MHGLPSIDRVLRQRNRKVVRPRVNLNQPVVLIGNWQLQEDADGHLMVTNIETGVSTIVGYKDDPDAE